MREQQKHAKFNSLGQLSTVRELTAENVKMISEMERASDLARTRGERMADAFAALVGSWPFIIFQSIALAIWVLLNLTIWIRHWDPYPFILLNLVLSFQAAFASPIIMMSQNRQGLLADRRNKLDLQINLLAEQESTQVLRLLKKLCEHAGIPLEDTGDISALSAATEPRVLAKQIAESSDAGHSELKKDG